MLEAKNRLQSFECEVDFFFGQGGNAEDKWIADACSVFGFFECKIKLNFYKLPEKAFEYTYEYKYAIAIFI